MSEKYSINIISNCCGIKAQTLRAWETRYGLFDPERTPGGQRLYSSEDLKRVLLIVKLQERGFRIGQLAKQTLEELESMVPLLDLAKASSGGVSSDVVPSRPFNKKFLLLLNDFRLDQIALEMSLLRNEQGAKSFIMNVILPLLREVGNLVAKGKYSVTQEHIISTLIREQLSQIQLPRLGDKRRETALATPEGNFHELPIIMADILCRVSKVPTRYLGASHPANCLGEALNALKSPHLILGALTSDEWDYQKQIKVFLQKLDKVLVYPLKVFIGGGETRDFPKFRMIRDVGLFANFEDLQKWLEG